MKRLLLPVLIICVMLGSAFASVNEDGVLMIPKTLVAPVIDAVMDSNVYRYEAATIAVVPDNAELDNPPDDYYDLFGSFRMAFDDAKVYLWLEVNDDLINPGADWQYDGVEIYFDADDSRGEAYDGVDDVQIRFNVGEFELADIDLGYGTSAGWGLTRDNFEYVVEETDLGWVLEVAFPIEDLQLVPDLSFGFDVQINDADESTRENMYRWWGDDNNAWQNATFNGAAILNSAEVIDGMALAIPKGSAPTIDGEMSPGEWADATSVSQDRLDNSMNTFDEIEDWTDLTGTSYWKWDDNNLYYLLTVVDDVNDPAPDNSVNQWEWDSIEIMFDADNSKGVAPYDGIDDIQIRYNLLQTTTDEIDAGYGDAADWGWAKENVTYATMETDLGWNIEVAMPLVDLQIEPGLEFGLETQLNDEDQGDGGGRTVSRWWGPSEDPWHNASLFGTAVLVAGTVGAATEKPAVVTNFDLSQNYPNPFNPTTSISYSVAQVGQVELTVYDMLGKEIATLVNEVKTAGQHTVSFDGTDLTSGIYFYTLTAGEQRSTNKMMLVK